MRRAVFQPRMPSPRNENTTVPPVLFHPNVTSFHIPNAMQAARAAELVYEEPSAIETSIRSSLKLDHFEFFDVSETQCFVGADKNTVLVSFRGTESDKLTDWITDSHIELVEGPLGGKVHAGFYDALAHVWQQVDRISASFDPQQNKSLWVTGHSLGAALATLSVARWLDAGRMVSGLYTFGQPRTGDTMFARNFNFAFKANTFRIVNNNDLVTRIPPRSLDYSHVGTFKYFTEEGELVENISWWYDFLESWKVLLDDVVGWASDGINDHSMAGYRDLIEQHLQAQRADSRSGFIRFLQQIHRRAA
jgi:triacylglycerol lipase